VSQTLLSAAAYIFPKCTIPMGVLAKVWPGPGIVRSFPLHCPATRPDGISVWKTEAIYDGDLLGFVRRALDFMKPRDEGAGSRPDDVLVFHLSLVPLIAHDNWRLVGVIVKKQFSAIGAIADAGHP
jgi:hypothetical protein